MEEEWRGVVGYPDYEVSSLGRVRKTLNPIKPFLPQALPPGSILKQILGANGMLYVNLSPGHKQIFTHVLICSAFHGTRPSKKHLAAHWDGDPLNNLEGNLRWATYKENAADRDRHGRTSRGSTHSAHKLPEDIVLGIYEKLHSGFSITEMSKELRIPIGTLGSIKYGHAWGWLTRSLNVVPHRHSQNGESNPNSVFTEGQVLAIYNSTDSVS